MTNIWTITKRELYAYFSSPIAYVTTAAFLIVQGYVFYIIIDQVRQAGMDVALGNYYTLFLLIFYTAMVTMRLLAEEQRSGTLELVLTAPVRDWELVIGKYLASVILFLLLIVISFYQPIVMMSYGDPDFGTMVSGYLGFFLLGSALLALGTLTSTFTSNQVVAAIISLGLCILLLLVQFVSPQVANTTFGQILNQLTILSHYFDFLDGLIKAQHVVYYISLVAASLFLATQVLQARRWR
ncbi:MAG: ABC transporter permease subunit [Anaerolineae bacterium]|nr:ABC transporter permease subunit [Anaerolineae bacterium]